MCAWTRNHQTLERFPCKEVLHENTVVNKPFLFDVTWPNIKICPSSTFSVNRFLSTSLEWKGKYEWWPFPATLNESMIYVRYVCQHDHAINVINQWVVSNWGNDNSCSGLITDVLTDVYKQTHLPIYTLCNQSGKSSKTNLPVEAKG